MSIHYDLKQLTVKIFNRFIHKKTNLVAALLTVEQSSPQTSTDALLPVPPPHGLLRGGPGSRRQLRQILVIQVQTLGLVLIQRRDDPVIPEQRERGETNSSSKTSHHTHGKSVTSASVLLLTSPSRPRSGPLHLPLPPPLRADATPPAAPPIHPRREAGLVQGWRSCLPSWRLGWGWWPCGTTRRNPAPPHRTTSTNYYNGSYLSMTRFSICGHHHRVF